VGDTLRARGRTIGLGRARGALEGDGSGEGRVDGEPALQLSGYLDVDLEASACTNALPVHRLGLCVGERADASAAYVRAPILRVEPLERGYARRESDGESARYEYVAPAFDFKAVLTYDRFGFVLDYPRHRRPGRLTGQLDGVPVWPAARS
jgi:uncharacterized protein